MKLQRITVIYLFISIMCSVWNFASGADMETTHVEGLFYRDGQPVTITIVDGKIDRIVRKEKIEHPDFMDVYVAPGFIDCQINGYVSISFSSPGLSVEGVRTATRALWKVGVTSYLPTIITSSHERLMENFAILAQATHDDEIGLSVPGFHLEGPYISPVDGYRGAHNKKWVREPDWQEFVEVNKAAENKILLITVAPETSGGIDFIGNCARQGIAVAIGHHNASAELIKQAVDNGVVVSTHLGNGCANTIHRHKNVLWPQLADDRLMATIIADGFHLLPEELTVFYKVKGRDRLILISDATKLAGMAPGEYEWDGKKIVMTPEGMIKYPEQNVLAGASFPISRGVKNMQKYTGCTLAEAVQMASTNPARLLGLNDRGEIKPGKRADLVFFKIDRDGLNVVKTIVAGKCVFQMKTE